MNPSNSSLRCDMKQPGGVRCGLTLVEILIALTMTLIVLFAMAQAFQFASGEIASGRATLEMSNRLRNAQQLMRTDLAGLTVDVRPHTETTPNGYFEYVDGPTTDKTALVAGTGNGYLGDIDDILAFTSRSLEGNFRGRFNGNTVQSSFAEIIWFTERNDTDGDGLIAFTESITLYRRVLLIRPDLNQIGNGVIQTTAPEDLDAAVDFFRNNDISARWIDTSNPPDGTRDAIVANSLSDLAGRENRFARDSRVFIPGSPPATAFPHTIDRIGLSNTKMGAANGFSGDDILLTDIAAFDVQVYSPDAGVDLVDLDGNNVAETGVQTSDIGYTGLNDSSFVTVKNGGFVDLGSDPDRNFMFFGDNAFERSNPSKPQFTTLPTARSQNVVPNPFGGIDVSYCTWSPHYESDGINQGDNIAANIPLGLVDEGTNGLDDNMPAANGVDDDSERETSPPYPYPVRGIKVTFRVIEKNTRQVRQSSVIQSFLPQ